MRGLKIRSDQGSAVLEFAVVASGLLVAGLAVLGFFRPGGMATALFETEENGYIRALQPAVYIESDDGNPVLVASEANRTILETSRRSSFDNEGRRYCAAIYDLTGATPQVTGSGARYDDGSITGAACPVNSNALSRLTEYQNLGIRTPYVLVAYPFHQPMRVALQLTLPIQAEGVTTIGSPPPATNPGGFGAIGIGSTNPELETGPNPGSNPDIGDPPGPVNNNPGSFGSRGRSGIGSTGNEGSSNNSNPGSIKGNPDIGGIGEGEGEGGYEPIGGGIGGFGEERGGYSGGSKL